MLPFPVPPPPLPAWLTDNSKPADDPAPSLRSHYRSLTATTSRSAGAHRNRSWTPSRRRRPHKPDQQQLFRCAPSPVPFGRGRSGSRRLHAGHHLASRRASARLIPGANSKTPVLMSSVFVSTRQQRFACARLPDPHLTPRRMPFPRSLTTTVRFSQRIGG